MATGQNGRGVDAQPEEVGAILAEGELDEVLVGGLLNKRIDVRPVALYSRKK